MHSSSFHLGHVRLPVYGVCTVLGLMGALALSQVTARRARLDPDKIWDAIMVIAVVALLVSRALLVARSFRFFLQQPLLVLSLPMVNDTGLLLTTGFALAYLRWKRLTVLQFLDALAPCAALLWTFLSLGRWTEGTREGMPFRSGAVWPVELLTAAVAALLCFGLLWVMRITRSPGRICACGFVAMGAAVFTLDFLRLPSNLGEAGILDPVQWLGLAMIVAGVALVLAVPAVKIGHADAV